MVAEEEVGWVCDCSSAVDGAVDAVDEFGRLSEWVVVSVAGVAVALCARDKEEPLATLCVPGRFAELAAGELLIPMSASAVLKLDTWEGPGLVMG